MAQIERVKKWIDDHPVPAAAYVLLTLFGVILLVAIIGFPNSFPDWVGVAEVTTPGLEQSQKTLWDWLDLFIVSLVVALALFWLNTSQRRREDDREKKRVKLEKEQQAERQEQEKARQEDRQHQATLQNYFDKMSELLLKEHLGEKVEQPPVGEYPNSKAAVIARARTLAVLRVLDPVRVTAVFRFLDEADLKKDIPLADGDLREVKWNGAYLREAFLEGAYMEGAVLEGARLYKANLSRANLVKTNLIGIFLRKAELRNAELREANLRWADLSKAKLCGTNLRKANLIEANLSGADLDGADLSEARYSEYTTWPEGFDPKELGAILVDIDGNPIEL